MKIITKSYRRSGNGRDSKVYFEVAFDERPESKDIYDAQVQLGYHPGGYGGPNDIKINTLPIAQGLGDGFDYEDLGYLYVANWSCYGSCD